MLQLLHAITELGHTGSQSLLYRCIKQGRVSLRTHPDTLHDHQRERFDTATSVSSEMTALAALIRDLAARTQRRKRPASDHRPGPGPRICPISTRALTRGLDVSATHISSGVLRVAPR